MESLRVECYHEFLVSTLRSFLLYFSVNDVQVNRIEHELKSLCNNHCYQSWESLHKDEKSCLILVNWKGGKAKSFCELVSSEFLNNMVTPFQINAFQWIRLYMCRNHPISAALQEVHINEYQHTEVVGITLVAKSHVGQAGDVRGYADGYYR